MAKKPSQGKLVFPAVLQLDTQRHPDVTENMKSISLATGITATTEIIKFALHCAVRELAGKRLNAIPRKAADAN